MKSTDFISKDPSMKTLFTKPMLVISSNDKHPEPPDSGQMADHILHLQEGDEVLIFIEGEEDDYFKAPSAGWIKVKQHVDERVVIRTEDNKFAIFLSFE